LFKNFKKDYPHSRLRLAIIYFPKCLTPGQEHHPELAIMSDPLNTFDVMDWLKKEAILSKYKLLHYRI